MLDAIQTILSILVLALAVLFGLVVERYTRDEIPSYKAFFRPLLWFAALFAALFYSIDLLIALTFTFIFIFILTIRIKTAIKDKIKRNPRLRLGNKKAK